MTPVPQPLILDRKALDTIARWQREAGPLEVCSLLAVDRVGAQHLVRLRNHAGLPGAFELSSADLDIAHAAAAERGWAVAAFVHTHPHHPPEMSARDSRAFASGTLPWIIVGTPLSGGVQRTFVRGAPDGATTVLLTNG